MENTTIPSRDELCSTLSGRLHVAYQQSFGKWTRDMFQDKARSVTAGMELSRFYGEKALNDFVNTWYDEEIPNFDKPENERVPAKRPIDPTARDENTRDAKRWKVDPLDLQDVELEQGKIQCYECRCVLKERDACYLINELGADTHLVCLSCWTKNDLKTHCSKCQQHMPYGAGLIHVYDHSNALDYFACKECQERFSLPWVVKMRRHEGKVVQSCDVYIGRRVTTGGWMLEESIWHNPFTLPKGVKDSAESRAELLAKYEAHVRSKPKLMERISTLGSKTLGCWCKPKACHGDVLVKLFKEWVKQEEEKKVSLNVVI